MKTRLLMLVAALGLLSCSRPLPAPNETAPGEGPWSFAVSGDSRNCGDIVMPAIASKVLASPARFYWHLGDYRAIERVDEDIQHDRAYGPPPLSFERYGKIAWQDFIERQLKPFGGLPVHLSVGNHELKRNTREDVLKAFAPWFGAPAGGKARTYYDWKERGVGFINLDNASDEQFDAEQLSWFLGVLARDEADPSIRTIVVGMHAALPDSLSLSHSMSHSKNPVAIESGRRVYAELLKARDQARKKIYVLASHSHYFMDGTFNTEYWNAHGGVLPGWIVGTAGAKRYLLPDNASRANRAMNHVYGYLDATVNPADGTIAFDFRQLEIADIPKAVSDRYSARIVKWCFERNALKPGAEYSAR